MKATDRWTLIASMIRFPRLDKKPLLTVSAAHCRGFLIECEDSIATRPVAPPLLVNGDFVDSGVEPG